ncbi:MAG: hydroxyethylthiazole kinase [Oscillospiraceae bacterium]|nr:hydroxyethylthiazole kinase [Oscillospiraceae bacterium]
MPNKYAELLTKVRGKSPLVQQITNFVTVHDCANITLAIGASPIMADAIGESADIAAISSALVLNMGTLDEADIRSMVAAGKSANANGVPVVFDPVGAGASKLRNDTVALLTKELSLSVIRGNISEIKFVAGVASQTKGVDAADGDMDNPESVGRMVKELAAKLGCTVVVSGAVDVLSDGERLVFIKNGHPMLTRLTGTGCMCTALIGSFCGVHSDPLEAAVAGMLAMGIAGEIAYEKAGRLGNGSFHSALLDAISLMDAQTVGRMARYCEA